ncbi:MAG: 3-oxoacyl-ACP reductase FabG [Planctomycetes bacterium]|nr:3-oxoacyl-ACP reductase FabG [Planctomycetota bacterium]
MTAAFTDRVALVTGGSRGIGRAVALRLALEGADVALSYVARREEAEATAAEVRRSGRRALAARCNVAEPSDVQELVRRTREELGPVSFLVHCGAISNLADHTELTYERWRETIEVNLNGTFLTVFAVKDEMIRRRFGRIVTLSSIAALLPRKLQMHYSASKAGVAALTRCCAEAFAPYGVRVNCIAPGLIDTEMAGILPEARRQEIIASTPLGRIGRPEEIASVARFLLSDESSFMTGQTILVSGGRMMMG